MLAKFKREILDLPRSLTETLEKGRSEYEATARETRWGEGPVYLVGSGPSMAISLTGAYAFESLPGWPAIPRTPQAFETYSLHVARSRSVVLLISPSGEEQEILSVAQATKSRGATVLALTAKPESSLAHCADGLLLFRRFDQQEAGVMSLVRQQAAVSYFALLAARALKRPRPIQESVAADFDKLPGQVEWVSTHLTDLIRSLIPEFKGLRFLDVVGAGFYHPTALLAAYLFRNLLGLPAQGWEVCDFISGGGNQQERDSLVVFLSGSRCRLKKAVHQAAAKARSTGAKVISVTDADDRELTARSTLSILLPSLAEVVGAPLSLSLLEWVVIQMGEERDRSPVARESGG